MKTHIITIGDEILIGSTLNTNAAFIGEKLTEKDFNVFKTSVVGDDEEAILNEFKEVYNDNDIILVTGGLGPTHDDITRECVTKFFNTQLKLNEEILNDVKERVKKRGLELTTLVEGQALVPEIATPIRNRRGTAPGIWIEKDNKVFIAMPGVPHEMSAMIEDFVIPKLVEKFGNQNENKITIHLLTTGIPEVSLYQKLGDLNELLSGAKMAFLPSQFGVKMRLTVTGKNKEEAQNKLSEIEQLIRSRVGRYIYGKDNESIEQVVGRLLKDRCLTLATAESCTGGLISSRITNVGGSSAYFERGFVTYSNGAKVEELNIDEDLIEQNGAVSIEVARYMAEGARKVSGTDIGLAVTGIMGPTGATEDKPVGLVYIGISDEKVCTAKKFNFGDDDRLLNKDRTSQAALEMLRRNLLGIPYDE